MTLEATTREALSEYFGSAVLFDDRLDLEPEPDIPGEVPAPEGIDADDLDPVEEPGEVRDAAIAVPLLVESFGEQGIVCTAHNPAARRGGADEPLPLYLTRLASHADITIIDWAMGDGDPGTIATALIRELIDGAHGLQFIVIYTERQRDDVAHVLEQVDGLEATESEVTWESDSVIVCFVNKGEVAVSGLADRVMELAARQLAGIMRVAAIRSAARVRRAMPHTLGLLGAEADAAILSHAIVTDFEDARALAAKVVRDELLGPAELVGLHDLFEPAAFAERVLDGLPTRIGEAVRAGKKAHPLVEVAPEGLEALITDDMTEVESRLRVGEVLLGNSDLGNHLVRGKPLGALSSCFVDGGRRADRQMLALTATTFGWPRSNPPDRVALGPGVVISVIDDSSLWLCVTPECDAVRIEEPKDFHFLPVEALDGDSNPFHSSDHFRMPLELGGEEERPLRVDMRFGSLRRCRFTPNPESRVVELSTSAATEALMSDPDDEKRVAVEVKPIAALKLDLTARIRHELATHGARIGLAEFRPDLRHRRGE